MKGRIFIAWSGTNELANQVRELLLQEDYDSIVGGGGSGAAAADLFVGTSVLHQIDQCSQALFIMQKKADGTISSNLMFELGYALARFNHRKIHVFYIDVSQNDPVIPTDLAGIWADHFDSARDTDVPRGILNKFLKNQRIIIPENKMTVVDSYYTFKDQLRRYAASPFCSEYELAQYVLFFSQAAYMFGDEREGKSVLMALSHSMMKEHPGNELVQAMRFGISYLNIYCVWKKGENGLYLTKADYSSIRSTMNDIEKELLKWPENDFSLWFKALLYNTINFILVIHSACPGTPQGNLRKMLDRSAEFAQKCLDACDKLDRDHLNEQGVQLYRAFMYRNLSTYHMSIQGSDEDIYANLQRSFDQRRMLMRYCEMSDLNTRLRDAFEMEYYLAMSELLGYSREDLGPELFNSFREECQRYIQRLQESNRERGYYIEKIEHHVASISDIELEDEY